MIRRINKMWRDGVAKALHGITPRRIQKPAAEVGHILNQNDAAAVVLGTSDDRPSGRAQGVMVRLLLSARQAVALASGRSKHYVMLRHCTPVRLLQVLARMCGFRVIQAVKITACRQWFAAHLTRTPAIRAPSLKPPAPAKRSIASIGSIQKKTGVTGFHPKTPVKGRCRGSVNASEAYALPRAHWVRLMWLSNSMSTLYACLLFPFGSATKRPPQCSNPR